MKRIHIIAGLFAFQFLASSQSAMVENDVKTFRPVPNNQLPFAVGEKLNFNIRYGLVKAGEATLEVEKFVNRRNRPTYHMVGTGKTTGMTDWIFPTQDRYETYIDTSSLFPVEFIRDVDEDGYIIKRHILFNQSNLTAKDLKKNNQEFDLGRNMQDIFSAFYYARSMDVKDIKIGNQIEIDVFLDHEHFPFILRYEGIDEVELEDEIIECMKFVPIVQEGRVFKEKETMTIWVSNDKNRIPVRLQSELLIGSIKVDLVSYENLSYPLNSRED